ncbi:MAG: hypothetical protein HN353_05435 [Bdellovibrionales bacterium]|nr:hypothetical protein [Bdellovibrionales bacterium]MBT3525115.1 hypothetical protein [Bdellovibrionales bacterium]MBT7765813.1 hypothetical protein [Bdellovibrionales bacterium]
MKNAVIISLVLLTTTTISLKASVHELLSYSNCSDYIGDVPYCDKVGTRSEGWYIHGDLTTNFTGEPAYDFCADKMAYCGAKGTRSEGWYIIDFMNLPLENLKSSNDCSESCSEQAADFCDGHPVDGAVCYATAYWACRAGCYQ